MKRLVFATNNSHKLEEARAILGDGLQLISLAEIGCHDDIPETQPTLEGNALQKARYIHERYGVDCVADDTGLMVDALDGAPGVYSARYAGPGHDSQANMKKLLKEMAGVKNRDAHFSTVLAYVTDRGEHTFEGRVEGSIATEPSGNAGFGYDPVFVARETGLTFADMDADAKNAISHRGRAFRLFRDWLAALTVIVIMAVSGIHANAAEWRQHMSYDGNTLRILDSPAYTYFIPLKELYSLGSINSSSRYGQLYRYDKNNDEWEWLNASKGLSENIVVSAAYDYRHSLLAIGYDNGNIDLLHDNGEKVNIPGLKTAGSNASSEIMDMNFDEQDGDLWIATASGYVRIDPVKGEVITSRNYSRAVLSVAKLGDFLIVATPDNVLYGDERSGDLNSFTPIPGTDGMAVRQMIPFGEYVFERSGNGNDYVGRFHTASGTPALTVLSSYGNFIYSMERGADCLVTSGVAGIDMHRKTYSTRTRPQPSAIRDYSPYAASYDGKTWWFSAGRLGYFRMNYPETGDEWTVTMSNYFPNASTAFKCTGMAYHPEYGMMVRNHGREGLFYDLTFTTPDLVSALHNGDWTPLSVQYVDRSPKYDNEFFVNNPRGLAIDPANDKHIYCGSYENGLFRLNLEEPKKSLRIGRVNDIAVGKPGFVPVTAIMSNWDQMCNFGTPVFDADGTLWTAFYNYDFAGAELWYWTKEDRLASTTASDYRPMKKLTYRNMAATANAHILPLSHRNRLVYHTGGGGPSVMVLDHGGTLDNTSDDVHRSFTTTIDQDGTTFNYGEVNHLFEDTSTGRVWVACAGGVYHFSPADVLNGQTSVRRVKIDRKDGSNLADLLLDGANVTHIATDPSGRKWFATLGAGIVVTSAAGTEILKTYTEENSELPGNNVYSLCYNPENKSMMISTGKGLCEIFLTSAQTSEESSVRAYPNPVRPNFLGNVTIDMLPDGAAVKIVDTNGRLIRELGTASGGEISWDLTNTARKRVPGGIYYVMASNGRDLDSFSRMTKILVVE